MTLRSKKRTAGDGRLAGGRSVAGRLIGVEGARRSTRQERRLSVAAQRSQFSRWNGVAVDRITRDILWTRCYFIGGEGTTREPGLCEGFFDEVAGRATRLGQRDRKGATQLAWKYEGDLEPILAAMRKRAKKGYYMLVGSGRGYALVCGGGRPCIESPGYMGSRSDAFE
jgi:hypothetical protein